MRSADNCCFSVPNCIVPPTLPSRQGRRHQPWLLLHFCSDVPTESGWCDSRWQPSFRGLNQTCFWDFTRREKKKKKNIISNNHCQSISIGHSLRDKWALLLQLNSFIGYNFLSLFLCKAILCLRIDNQLRGKSNLIVELSLNIMPQAISSC